MVTTPGSHGVERVRPGRAVLDEMNEHGGRGNSGPGPGWHRPTASGGERTFDKALGVPAQQGSTVINGVRAGD
ncbi:hypothetical protein AB0F77_35975 [Streptomyces sp. NPDC026672]|uniref:hypothetical protein n=1 Tax=unclassified Streptomyces TaxID=2593676 RepID=UPI0033C0807D